MTWAHDQNYLDTFETLRRFQKDFNRFFENSTPNTSLEFGRCWLTKEDDRVTVVMIAPGLRAEDFELQSHRETLKISGARHAAGPERQEVLRRERPQGEFSRTVELPFPVDADKAEAKYENGILTIRLARSAADKPKLINVK